MRPAVGSLPRARPPSEKVISMKRLSPVIALAAAALALPAVAHADVTPNSTINRIVGQPLVYGFGGDGGPAIDATLNQPRDTTFGPDGTMYIVDTFNNRVRHI